MRYRLIILLIALSVKAFSQEKAVAGMVFDKDNKGRIAKVNIHNLNTGTIVYDNLNGVFSIDAEPGDEVVFSKQDYHDDTVKISSHMPIAVYMSRIAAQLREVTIRDTAMTPANKMAAAKKEYSRAYGRLANKDLLSIGPLGGAGLSIDALWNMVSREGKDAANLRAQVDRDYKQDVVDYRFNRTLVSKVTGLKDKKLTEFMQRYRPGYFFVVNATDYEFIVSIKNNYKRYLRNPRAYPQPPLMPQKQ